MAGSHGAAEETVEAWATEDLLPSREEPGQNGGGGSRGSATRESYMPWTPHTRRCCCSARESPQSGHSEHEMTQASSGQRRREKLIRDVENETVRQTHRRSPSPSQRSHRASPSSPILPAVTDGARRDAGVGGQSECEFRCMKKRENPAQYSSRVMAQ